MKTQLIKIDISNSINVDAWYYPCNNEMFEVAIDPNNGSARTVGSSRVIYPGDFKIVNGCESPIGKKVLVRNFINTRWDESYLLAILPESQNSRYICSKRLNSSDFSFFRYMMEIPEALPLKEVTEEELADLGYKIKK